MGVEYECYGWGRAIGRCYELSMSVACEWVYVWWVMISIWWFTCDGEDVSTEASWWRHLIPIPLHVVLVGEYYNTISIQYVDEDNEKWTTNRTTGLLIHIHTIFDSAEPLSRTNSENLKICQIGRIID